MRYVSKRDIRVLAIYVFFEEKSLGRNVNRKLSIFELTLWLKTYIACYFIFMYQSEINYRIYTS